MKKTLLITLIILTGCSSIPEHKTTCTDPSTDTEMTVEDAIAIAQNSTCTEEGPLIEDQYLCNDYTGTWWLNLDIDQEGCNPACVVNIETQETEINWRCTGLIE